MRTKRENEFLGFNSRAPVYPRRQTHATNTLTPDSCMHSFLSCFNQRNGEYVKGMMGEKQAFCLPFCDIRGIRRRGNLTGRGSDEVCIPVSLFPDSESILHHHETASQVLPSPCLCLSVAFFLHKFFSVCWSRRLLLESLPGDRSTRHTLTHPLSHSDSQRSLSLALGYRFDCQLN